MYRLRFLAISLAIVLKASYADKTASRESLQEFLLQESRKYLPPLSYEENFKQVTQHQHLHRLFQSNHKHYSQRPTYLTNVSDYEDILSGLNSLQMRLMPSAIAAELPNIEKQLLSKGNQGEKGQGVPVSDFATCSADFATIVASLRGNAPWAVQMFDAWGKPGSGIVQGDLGFMGGFDECIQTEVTGGHFSAQHCVQYMGVTKIGSIKFPQPLTFVLGTCVPSTCTAEDVKNVINIYFATQPNITAGSGGGHCYDPNFPLSNKAISVIVVCGIFASLMAAATLYDILIAHANWTLLVPAHLFSSSEFLAEKGSGEDPGPGETEPLLNSQPVAKKKFEPNVAEKALLCFSVYTNGAKVLATRQVSGSIDCIHGIRFLSMSWVILGHSFIMGFQVTDNKVNYVEQAYKRWTFMALTTATVSVDTFFTISGLLLAYLVLKELSKKPVSGGFFFNFYFHRFWRLTPPYMLVMMVYITLLQYFGDGPFWPQYSIEKGECESNWWSNLLYINNLHKFGGKPMCMGWSWYLANDMQFYIISPAIFLTMFYFGWRGLILPLLLILGNAITTGVLSSKNDLIATTNVLFPQHGGDYNDIYYVKPYCRIGPYLVGMITGYLLYRTNCTIRMNRLSNCLGWAVATAVALAVVYGPFESTNGHPMSTEVAALYNALARTAWGASVCWVIFACSTGYGGFVNTLLSWKAFVPLSRLTYCAYLVHICVIYAYMFSQRRFFYIDNTNIVFLFLGVLVVSMMVAFVASMAFEAPFMGLEKILIPAVKTGYRQISYRLSQSRNSL